ncbi:hypothetical protein KFF05_01240 [bacterium SCSIO 12827]|nr:hypothetical protein KFF05_01240 [bacterium SCSIO 12827]
MNEKRASEEAHEGHQKNSVYDFLYCDTPRIGSFLAQFDDAGFLKQIIERESVAKSTSRGFKVGLSGGATIAGTGGNAGLDIERGPSASGSESSERVYDPLWTNARTLLDYLAEYNLIKRNIEEARIGQFVLATGELEVKNLSMLRAAWQDETIKKLLDQGQHEDISSLSRQQRRAVERKGAKSSVVPTDNDVALAFMKILPHAVQAHIQGDTLSAWCNLLEDGLVVSADELLLKHGIRVSGTWHVLGILDAFPGSIETDLNPSFELTEGGVLGALLTVIAPVARLLLGRPPNSYGITPLLIFREVSG